MTDRMKMRAKGALLVMVLVCFVATAVVRLHPTQRAIAGSMPPARLSSSITMPIGRTDDLLSDTAMLCIDARQYVVTDVSEADHKLLTVRRNGQPVPCTGGVSLVVVAN